MAGSEARRRRRGRGSRPGDAGNRVRPANCVKDVDVVHLIMAKATSTRIKPATPKQSRVVQSKKDRQLGYVYVLSNTYMPDILKIGFTTSQVPARMKQLDTVGVPYPFECLAAYQVENWRKVERKIFEIFAEQRVRPNREFFKVDIRHVRAALELTGGVDALRNAVKVGEDAGVKDEVTRQAVGEERKRAEKFRFDRVRIRVGSRLQSSFDKRIQATVADGNKVIFRGKTVSIMAAAMEVAREFGIGWPTIQGTLYWLHKGKRLVDYIR